MLHYILQGAGRGGRKNESCKRKQVLVYILFNKSDIGDNVPGKVDLFLCVIYNTQCFNINYRHVKRDERFPLE